MGERPGLCTEPGWKDLLLIQPVVCVDSFVRVALGLDSQVGPFPKWGVSRVSHRLCEELVLLAGAWRLLSQTPLCGPWPGTVRLGTRPGGLGQGLLSGEKWPRQRSHWRRSSPEGEARGPEAAVQVPPAGLGLVACHLAATRTGRLQGGGRARLLPPLIRGHRWVASSCCCSPRGCRRLSPATLPWLGGRL